MSLPLAASMPFKPGEEFTSIITGPWLERSISTPQTFKPMIFAARTAVERSSGVKRIRAAEPPRCQFERNSPTAPWRFIAATT